MIATVNGINLYYEEVGTGQPLILLHGNGEDGSVFQKIVSAACKKHRVLTIDARGHGKSDQNCPITYQLLAEDVIGLCDQLKLSNCTLFGFSDGGIVGLLVASQRPQLLSRLIVAGANASPRGLHPFFYCSFWIGYLFCRKERVKMMLTQPNITKDQLGKITCPTLVMAGEHDLILRRHTRWIASAIPQAQLKILRGETHSSYVLNRTKILEYL